jgi:hypothetical protein
MTIEGTSPSPETGWIASVLAAFERRSKAIKYHVSRWEVDVSDGVGLRRVNFDAVRLRCQIRLSVWEDGAMWYRAGKPGPRRTGGWVYLHAIHLENNARSAHDIVAAFERSLEQSHDLARLMECWSAFSPRRDASVT